MLEMIAKYGIAGRLMPVKMIISREHASRLRRTSTPHIDVVQIDPS
jgi:hypothetical protein